MASEEVTDGLAGQRSEIEGVVAPGAEIAADEDQKYTGQEEANSAFHHAPT